LLTQFTLSLLILLSLLLYFQKMYST